LTVNSLQLTVFYVMSLLVLMPFCGGSRYSVPSSYGGNLHLRMAWRKTGCMAVGA